MTAKQKKKVNEIKDVLDRQTFYDFYAKIEGEYDMYIGNRRDKKTEKEIDEKIFYMFLKVIGK